MSRESLLSRATAKVRAGELLAALEAYLELTWKEASADLWNDRGMVHHLLQEEELAAECFARALAEEPRHFLARANAFYLAEAGRVQAEPVLDVSSLIRFRRSWGETPAPLVSVLMPTYNRAGRIRESIESVLRQTFRDFELLVINDGGDRGVEAVLESLHEPRVRYVYAEHGGLSQALNVGIAEARGKYLAFLDDDDIYYPEHLERLVAAAEAQPEPTVVYADSYQVFQPPSGAERPAGRRRLRSAGAEARERLAETNPIPVLALFCPKSCFQRVGGFRVPLLMGMDWDLQLRLAEAFPFRHVAQITSEYRTRSDASQITGALKPEKNYWDNLVLYLNRRLRLFSFPQDPTAENAYARAVRFLQEMADPDSEESLRALSLRELWRMQKPHRYFIDQAEKQMAVGRRGLAQKMSAAALRFGPWEPKAWRGWWRAR